MSLFRKSGDTLVATLAPAQVQGAGATLTAEQRAALAYRRGDKQEALRWYREAAREAPTDPGVQKALADFCLVGLGDREEALQAYQRVLGLTPHDPAVLQILGNLCVATERTTEARQYLGALASLQPGNTEVKKALEALTPRDGSAPGAEALMTMIHDAQRSLTTPDMQNVDDALDRLMQYKQRHAPAVPAATGPTYDEIVQIAGQGREAEAIGAFERFLVASPHHAGAHNDLGVLYYRTGRPQEAVAQYRMAVDAEPRNTIFRKNLADALFIEQRDTEAALRQYVEILTIEPRDAETLMALAQVCIELQRYDDAMTFLNTLLSTEPWHQQARELRNALQTRMVLPSAEATAGIQDHARAVALYEEGRKNEAVALLEEHVRANPGDAQARNDLGVMLAGSGRIPEAGAHYEEAARLDPSNDVFVKNLADYYAMALGRTEDALRLYVGVLNRNPRDVETLLGIGRICEMLQRTADARDFYRKALDCEPWNTVARELLSRLGG